MDYNEIRHYGLNERGIETYRIERNDSLYGARNSGECNGRCIPCVGRCGRR